MTSANIRQKLHQYVNNGDEKLLKLMYALAKEYNEDDDEFHAELDRRTDEYENGKANRLTIDELELRVREAHKSNISS